MKRGKQCVYGAPMPAAKTPWAMQAPNTGQYCTCVDPKTSGRYTATRKKRTATPCRMYSAMMRSLIDILSLSTNLQRHSAEQKHTHSFTRCACSLPQARLTETPECSRTYRAKQTPPTIPAKLRVVPIAPCHTKGMFISYKIKPSQRIEFCARVQNIQRQRHQTG